MKVMNKENQNFADYVSQISDTELDSDYISQVSNAEVIYDSDYDDLTPGSDYTDSNSTRVSTDSDDTTSSLDGTTCSLDDGELTCGDDFADNGETIQGGPCQDLIEYFSDKPYLD